MKCKCGNDYKRLVHTPLTLKNENEATRIVFGKCDECGDKKEWREHFVLSHESEIVGEIY